MNIGVSGWGSKHALRPIVYLEFIQVQKVCFITFIAGGEFFSHPLLTCSYIATHQLHEHQPKPGNECELLGGGVANNCQLKY